MCAQAARGYPHGPFEGWHGGAVAGILSGMNTITPSPTRVLLWVALMLPFVAGPVAAAELYRWVDAQGQLVYATEVPEAYRPVAVLASTPLPPGTSACEALWHRYLASAACFDQYRVVGGGLKPEAFQRCTEVPQPEPCR